MKLMELMDKMNYNLKSRSKTGKSMLGEIERDLIDVFVSQTDISIEQKETFEAHLISNEAVMNDSNINYRGLNEVKNYYGDKVQLVNAAEHIQTR